MKKIFTIAALLAGTFIFAQDNDNDNKMEHKKIPGRNIRARGMYSDHHSGGCLLNLAGQNTDGQKALM